MFLAKVDSAWGWLLLLAVSEVEKSGPLVMEPVRIHVPSGEKLPKLLREFDSGSLRAFLISECCSFPDSLHPSQHSRWDNSKRTYYD